MRNDFVIFSLVSILLVGLVGYFLWTPILWLFVLLVPLLVLGYYDMFQAKHAIMRNYPLLGRGRYWMEELRPKIYQYFVESDTNGRPFNRLERSVVYQRAKKVEDTTPFGTQMDVYAEGYEWMNHSINAFNPKTLPEHPRVLFGGKQCSQPYEMSILNVSAMSFGSLSKNAIMSLNGGAKIGGFAHNTGEGGISPYHLEPGGDLVYQVGTGYFGCRGKDANFDPDLFAETVAVPNVKMIELKLSQGAKPGHGGILPAKKNTLEIAKIRKVEPFTEVDSPPFHRAFNNPVGLLELLQKMRELSAGRPVGFKLCIGNKSEFVSICKAILETGIYPDFITIDGGEGGTGAAPIEFSNSVGMPFRDGLAFAHDTLVGFDLRKDIRIIASGKISSGFDIMRAKALGADTCNSARAMMLALGCIQALLCNQNTCPTGVATQDPELVKGLVTEEKRVRIANFHRETIKSFVQLQAAAGFKDAAEIDRSVINRRVLMNVVNTYQDIYPPIAQGSLLSLNDCPPDYKLLLQKARLDRF